MPVPVQIPLGEGAAFRGVIDLMSLRAVVWDEAGQGMQFHDEAIPDEDMARAQQWRAAMVETAAALANLDEILSVDEVDGIYIGPADLSLSLGYPPSLLPTDGAVWDAIAEIRIKAKAAGKAAAVHCGSPGMVRDMLAAGFDLATLVTDARLFANALTAGLNEARAVAPTTNR